MRVSVAIEGLETLDRRYIAPGALKFPENRVPVIMLGTREIVGSAGDFQRDADGLITADVEVSVETADIEGSYAVEIDQPELSDGNLTVTSGRIRTLAVGAKWNWPKTSGPLGLG